MCLGGEAALNQLWYVWGQCIGGYCCPDTGRNLVKQEILRSSTKDINIINCKMLYFWNYPSNLFDQQTQRAVPSTSHYKWRKWQSRYCPIWCHGLINKQQIRSLSRVGDSIKCHVGWGAPAPAQWGDGNNKMLSRHNLQIMSLIPNSEIMSSIVKWINTICALNTECLLRLNSCLKYAQSVDSVTKANQNPLTFNIQLSDVIPFPIPIPVNIKYLSSDTCTDTVYSKNWLSLLVIEPLYKNVHIKDDFLLKMMTHFSFLVSCWCPF